MSDACPEMNFSLGVKKWISKDEVVSLLIQMYIK